MRERTPPPQKLPFWHRSRMHWVNAGGFALTFYLTIWLLLAIFSNVMPNADPIEFPIPTAFVVVLAVAHAATVALGITIVCGFMLRGANLNAHRPRMFIFYWTCAGVLFFLVQVLIMAKFGFVDLPNATGFASDLYWGLAPMGLATFALMAYVNVEIPSDSDEHDDEWDEDDEYDDDVDYEDDDQYEEDAH